MSDKIEMVVFDMAGTTVNENNLVYKMLRKAINEEGFNFSLDQVLTEGAGKEKKQAIRSILAAYATVENEELTNIIYNRFMGHLNNAYATEEIFPQPNSIETFKRLRDQGIFSVLNTGYDGVTANAILKKLGWRAGVDFDLLVTASDVAKNRPDPDMINLAMQKLNITDSCHVVKVGDSIIDIEEGQNAGCRLNIGITTGAHTAGQLRSANPDGIINDLIELLPMIEKENR